MHTPRVAHLICEFAFDIYQSEEETLMTGESIGDSRQSWTVRHVHFVGVARNVPGELTNFLRFRAQLQSATSQCVVEVQVDARSFYRLLKRLGMARANSGQPQHGVQTRNITKVIEELLAVDLSSDEADRWDPVRFTHWQLGESSMAGFTEGSLVDGNGTRDFYLAWGIPALCVSLDEVEANENQLKDEKGSK
jgi:hypothetical protein